MLSSIPTQIQSEIKNSLSSYSGENVILDSFKFSSGGCINYTGTLETSAGRFFLKWNIKQDFPGMFEKEAEGLELLSEAAGNLRIPRVVSTGESDNEIFILLEQIDSAHRASKYWEVLGSGLAELHRKTNDNFGLNHDNYIGSLVQINWFSKHWLDFFVENRLLIPFKMAYEKALLSKRDKLALDNLLSQLENLFPKNIKPSLIHGDLWSGNLMTDEHGMPCLIDPAVYYGFREMEIAFTQLFGRYSNDFYDSYNNAWRLEPGFDERVDIWNLYPLLVHVNLFGTSYSASVSRTLQRYL